MGEDGTKTTIYERMTSTPSGKRVLMWLASISATLISFAAMSLIGWVWHMNGRLAAVESRENRAQDRAQWEALRDIREDIDNLSTQTKLHRYMFDTTDRKIYITLTGTAEEQILAVPEANPFEELGDPSEFPDDPKLEAFRRLAEKLEKERAENKASDIEDKYIQQQEQRVIPRAGDKR